MSTASDSSNRVTLVAGPVGGVLAWVVGYGLVYLLTASEIENSPIQQLIEIVQGEPATYKMVGWTFYNAHFVEVTFQGVPAVGDVTQNFIGSDGFSVLLYLIPAGLLLTTGVALGRAGDARDVADGIIAGVSVVPGYLVCSVVGVFLFEISIGTISGGPALLPGVLLAGLLYPAFFAGLGGGLAALTAGG